MVPLSYVFTIFFVTLGPLKTIPAFAGLTRDLPAQACQGLAARSTLNATVIVLAIALVVRAVLEKWKVSIDAELIAGGALLFIASIQTIRQFSQPGSEPGQSSDGGEVGPGRSAMRAESQPSLNALAATPLAVPIIVTPAGMVAILAFMDSTVGNPNLTLKILGLLLLVMALNWLGMFFARPFMRVVGVTTLQVVGWMFAVLQAGLAVQMILIALAHLGVIPTGAHR